MVAVPMIFDAHCHLGDILHLGGGAVIRSGLPMARPFDPDALSRLFLYGFSGLDSLLCSIPLAKHLASRAERLRNCRATPANLSAMLDRFGVSHAAVMPVAPNVTFDDVLGTSRSDARLVPFGSFDFTLPDLPDQAKRQLALGARGFKLHPILQNVPPDGPEVSVALSALPDGTAVLLHAGEADYYPKHEKHLQTPAYGAITGIERLCRAFPRLKFVAAHGGLRQFRELVERLAPLPNVSVDTSFVSPQGIRILIDSFGARRVLFASDWPWGYYATGIAAVRKACRGDQKEYEMVIGGNAGELLGL